MADLSESLRSDLVLCFILGAADYMNGAPCTGEELIPPSLATPLIRDGGQGRSGLRVADSTALSRESRDRLSHHIHRWL